MEIIIINPQLLIIEDMCVPAEAHMLRVRWGAGCVVGRPCVRMVVWALRGRGGANPASGVLGMR